MPGIAIRNELVVRFSALCVAVAALSVSGCAVVGPDYVRPVVRTPTAFKEIEGWKTAQPQDVRPKGAWWTIYGDLVLNGLEEQVGVSNQTVAQAEAQYRQARACDTSTGRVFPNDWSVGGPKSRTIHDCEWRGAERSGDGARSRAYRVLGT